jgi:hypothetical protein
MAGEKTKGKVWGQIIVAVTVALLVGSTAPWWWEELKGSSNPGSSSDGSYAGEIDTHLSDEVLEQRAAATKAYWDTAFFDIGKTYDVTADLNNAMRIFSDYDIDPTNLSGSINDLRELASQFESVARTIESDYSETLNLSTANVDPELSEAMFELLMVEREMAETLLQQSSLIAETAHFLETTVENQQFPLTPAAQDQRNRMAQALRANYARIVEVDQQWTDHGRDIARLRIKLENQYNIQLPFPDRESL